MSRDLPAHANLDHLRKQAKDRLQDLQGRNPASKLADAQHDVAREYGFVSWPKLKAHVEAAAASNGGNAGGSGGVAANAGDDSMPDYGFVRYTSKARQALYFSRGEAAQAGSASIDPEHVLLGLIRAGQRLRSRVFEPADLSLDRARAEAAAFSSERDPVPPTVAIPFGAGTTEIFRHAIEEADRLRQHDIGLAHLLLGMLHDERSTATSLLRNKGIRLDTVRDDLAELLREESI